MSRREFDVEYIRGEFDKLSLSLPTRTTVYIAGGFVLASLGLKAGTKDIDVVINNKPWFDSLTKGLSEGGYRTVQGAELTKVYKKIVATAILENEDGFRWDVFLRVVANKLFLSNPMKKRGTEYFDKGKLKVYTLSKEDVFLMKSVTGRERDLEDMSRTARAGIDYETVYNECMVQWEHTQRAWGDGLYQTCKELKEVYGVEVPFLPRLRREAELQIFFNALKRELNKGNNTERKLSEALKNTYSHKEVADLLRASSKAGKVRLFPRGKFALTTLNSK